jgi:hypothetical protein
MSDIWFKLYARDYLMDPNVDGLPPEAEGLLVRMWCLCNLQGYCPSQPESLARRTLRPVDYVTRWLPHCLPFFETRGDQLVSRRMESEKRRSETNRKNARERWKSQSQKQEQNQNQDQTLRESDSRNAIRIANPVSACVFCNGEKVLHQLPDVPGPRLVPCPDCETPQAKAATA